MAHDGPSDEAAVRNSVALGAFLSMAAHPKVSWKVVEPAGRGVTAAAAATGWVVEFGKPSLDGLTLSGKLIELGEWEDELAELWRGYGSGEVDSAAFETGLERIVTAMERWPSHP